MFDPKKLEFDVLQSENFVEESYPGAGDGKGWRLCKNGDYQIGSSRGIAGEVITPVGSLRISKEMIEQASLTSLAGNIRQTVRDVINNSEVLQGMRSGRISEEQTERAESDMALASGIAGMRPLDEWTQPVDGVGKEFLYVKQPGGPVEIGDLQKCCGRDTFTEQFLNREVRSDLKPEVVCALSMAAPMTANGKVPLNNLPRPVDDDK